MDVHTDVGMDVHTDVDMGVHNDGPAQCLWCMVIWNTNEVHFNESW